MIYYAPLFTEAGKEPQKSIALAAKGNNQHTITVSVVGLTRHYGPKLICQTSPDGNTDANTSEGWTTIMWDNGTPLIFKRDDTAEIPSCNLYFRVISEDTEIDEHIKVFLK
jgi:hypothetical protein